MFCYAWGWDFDIHKIHHACVENVHIVGKSNYIESKLNMIIAPTHYCVIEPKTYKAILTCIDEQHELYLNGVITLFATTCIVFDVY